MARMTSSTLTDIKEIKVNSDKLFSAKLDSSSVDDGKFSEIFENANKNNNVSFDSSQNSGSNSLTVTNSADYQYAFKSESLNSENNSVKSQNNHESSNQNSETIVSNKQDIDSNTVNSAQDKDTFLSNKEKLKQNTDVRQEPESKKTVETKSDKVVASNTDKKTKETIDDKTNSKTSKEETSGKDTKVVSEESKDQLKTRIQLAMVMDVNIATNKVTDIANKTDNKSSQSSNVVLNNSEKQVANKTTIIQNGNQSSPLKISDTNFQLVKNQYLSKSESEQNNNVKSLKQDSSSAKNLTNTQIQQENLKVDNKSINKENLKDDKKIEVLVQSNYAELNTDNLKQTNNQVSSSTQKELNEIFSKNGAAKPVITKIELNNNSNDSGQNQKQNLMDGQAATIAAQVLQQSNLSQSAADNTVTFDKVMNNTLDSKIDTNSVLNQISQRASTEIQSGKSEISMILRPEGLGKVDISVTSENGIVAAKIIAENSQVKEILSNEIDTLKQKLQDQGINFDNVVVKIQEPAKANNDNSNFDQDTHKFNQAEQNTSNSSDFSSSNKSQDKMGQKQLDYDTSDILSEAEIIGDVSNSEVHQGLVDYRI